MKRVSLRPTRPGLVVRDPESGEKLPAEGAEKVLSGYWQRRIQDGDVEVTEPRKARRGRASASAKED